MNFYRISLAVILAAALFAGTAVAAPITLTAGTGIGVESDGNRIIQYDSSGSVLGSVDITSQTYTGIAQVGSELYVASFASVYSVNLSTGALTFAFTLSSTNENLGRRGGNLIGANYGTGLVNEYTTGGAFVG